MSAPIVCFGETLWDVLPTGRQPGGAPFNVAVHLHQFGQPVQLISRVGQDDLGSELLGFLQSKGVDTALVQRSPTHLTGVVKANLDNSHEVTYKIVEPVAWDYVQYAPELKEAVANAAMLVYGSLAARRPDTRETLYQLLPSARYRVFDVNLRPPHYTRAVVENLLRQADMAKLNEHELAEITEWVGLPADEATALPWLAEHYGLQAVCVTKGGDGATLWVANQLFTHHSFPIEVKDTIGSGDAFLAALLAGWQAKLPPADCLRRACAAGGLVASHQGATPALTPADVDAMLG
jgi:fructokinase